MKKLTPFCFKLANTRETFLFKFIGILLTNDSCCGDAISKGQLNY